ncbi:uncharacterized protein LOC135492787 [Lineus longissimus]|uniref:uncharacterized protein LOC135492787 n=1 Tax=Lineus longissimus TaxID=88925 RepID=UPI002B4EC073
MGKHQHRRASKGTTSPNKNKDQLREAILKVFRARASSPGGGGGILVGKADQKPMKQNESHRPMNDIRVSDECSQGSASSSQKVKRLKTASERNKLRAKTQCDKSGRADFKKHLKRAQEITTHSKVGNQQNEGFSAITQNRLTTRLGLFNKGKKSHKIARDPIVLSKSVQERTEKDLLRILELSRSQDESGEASIGTLENERTSSKMMPPDHRSPCYTQARFSQEDKESPAQSQANSLDSSPALSEIASELISSLKPKSLFQGSDYAEETTQALRRIMKQSRRMTPPQMKMTPLTKVSSATVKRSLIHSLPPSPTRQNFSSYAASDPVSILAMNEQLHQHKGLKPETFAAHELGQGKTHRDERLVQASFNEPHDNHPLPMDIELSNDTLQVDSHDRTQYRSLQPDDEIWGSGLPVVHRVPEAAEGKILGNTIRNFPSYGQAVRTEYNYPPIPPYYNAQEGDTWPQVANTDISHADPYRKGEYHQEAAHVHDEMDILDYADTSSHYRKVKEYHQDLCYNRHFCPANKNAVAVEPEPQWLVGLPCKPSSHIPTPEGHFKRHALH